MKRLINAFLFLITLVVLFEAYLLISHNLYINNVLKDTIFKGKLGPSIDNYSDFAFRKIKAETPQKWSVSKRYNQYEFTQEQQDYFEKHQSVAYLVIHQDSIIQENYWDIGAIDSRTNSFSAAKTIVSILIGIAIEEGHIKSVNQKLSYFLPEYDSGSEIRLKDLLTMSSGIDFDENYINPFSFPAQSYYGFDLKKHTYSYLQKDMPGKVWRYRGGDTQLLAFVLEKATGMKIADYATAKLWNFIGAEQDAFWSLDVENGDEKASCCFISNARDFARIGKLYLNKGNWDGHQLVNKTFVEESIKPASYLRDEFGNINSKYGYQWWIMEHQGNNVFYARGILGQYIFVIPEKDLIVVRLGHKRQKVDGEDHPRDVKKYLDYALEIL